MARWHTVGIGMHHTFKERFESATRTPPPALAWWYLRAHAVQHCVFSLVQCVQRHSGCFSVFF